MSLTLRTVTEETLPLLYRMNREMAIREGQSDLFTAEYDTYAGAFRGPFPLVHGELIYQKDELIGFVIWQEKFATYPGKKVFYIEDVYLGDRIDDPEIFAALLNAIEHRLDPTEYGRIEIRRLERYAPPINPLYRANFHPIDKWTIWRKSL